LWGWSTDRSEKSSVAFVECVLVEFTHENIGAKYRSSNVWGDNRSVRHRRCDRPAVH